MTDTAAVLTMIFSTPLASPAIVQGVVNTGSISASHRAVLDYAAGSPLVTVLLVVALVAAATTSFVLAGISARRERALRRTCWGPWWVR